MKTLTLLMMFLTTGLSVLFMGCSQLGPAEPSKEEMIGPVIQADCISHYYKSNGSAYITRQQHEFSPSKVYFRSISSEPTGLLESQLLEDDFTVSGQPKDLLPDMPRELWDKQLAVSVYYGFTAGGDLLDPASMEKGEKVKIEGRWYQPMFPTQTGKVKVTLLKSLDTKRIELIKTENDQEGFAWMVMCYNYRYSKKLEKPVPRTIDVFDISKGIASKALMIRYDYKSIR